MRLSLKPLRKRLSERLGRRKNGSESGEENEDPNDCQPLPCNEWYTAPASVIKTQIMCELNRKKLMNPDKHGSLPLHLALRYGNHTTDAIARMIQRAPSSAQHANQLGQLPLHYAAKYSSCETIQVVLDAYPGGIKQQDSAEGLPLHWACKRAKEENILFLLSRYPNAAKEPDGRQFLPLHLVCQKSLISKNCLEAVYLAFPQAMYHRGWAQTTPFQLLCESVNEAKLEQQRDALAKVQFLFEACPRAATQLTDGEIPFQKIADSRMCEYLIEELLISNPDALLVIDNDTNQNNLLHLLYYNYTSRLDMEDREKSRQNYLGYDGQNHRYACQDPESIKRWNSILQGILIQHEPRLVDRVNARGELPLHIFLKRGPSKGKSEESAKLINVQPDSCSMIDPVERLFPFMLAAIGDAQNSSLTATFILLQIFVANNKLI